MEKATTRCGRQLRVYCIGSRVQLKRCGPPAWILSERPKTAHRTNKIPRIVQKNLILEQILWKDVSYGMEGKSAWAGLNWLRKGQVADSCEHGNESSVAIKCEDFLTS